VNKRREIENVTKIVRKIEIERLTKDDKELNDDCSEKTSDDKMWLRWGKDSGPESGGDEMKILRGW